MAAAPAAATDGRRSAKGAASAPPPSASVTSAAFLFFLVVAVGVVVSARWITTTGNLSITNLEQWRPKPVTLTATSIPTPTPTTTSAAASDAATLHSETPTSPSPPPPSPPPTPSPLPPPSPPPPPPPPPPLLSTCPNPPLPLNVSLPPNISQTLPRALAAPCSPTPPPPIPSPTTTSNASSCPSYFRYIHEDLHPWRAAGGITRAMLDRARATASFRLVVLRGRAFVERYLPAFQTRDLFTLWGVLQLLRRYPGRVPDLDLMFDCVDWPVVRADEYRGENATVMPPLFRYCGDDETLDIVFPDWSFWGWPEINIKPWDALQKDLKDGNRRVSWMDREPYAYWKGNTEVAVTRQELVKCNVSSTQEWNARIYSQDWIKEGKAGYKESDLGSQCTHRYKIYIEGSAWSVSEKYILACDSMTLIVTPKYYDFFSRVLMPIQHYWPVREDNKCSSIKYAVDWGNSHKRKAHDIGQQASNFIQNELNMEYVYDYMLHLLTEYAKLLRFKPTKPSEAVEICPESLACQAQGLEKKFMMDSVVTSAHDAGPCDLPPPFTPEELRMLQRRKENSIKQVEMWEQSASKRVDSER